MQAGGPDGPALVDGGHSRTKIMDTHALEGTAFQGVSVFVIPRSILGAPPGGWTPASTVGSHRVWGHVWGHARGYGRSFSSRGWRNKVEAVPPAPVETFIRRKDTASGMAKGGVVDLNGAYRARTGDLLLAKQPLSQLS